MRSRRSPPCDNEDVMKCRAIACAVEALPPFCASHAGKVPAALKASLAKGDPLVIERAIAALAVQERHWTPAAAQAYVAEIVARLGKGHKSWEGTRQTQVAPTPVRPPAVDLLKHAPAPTLERFETPEEPIEDAIDGEDAGPGGDVGIPPFLRWVGGKRWAVPQLVPRLRAKLAAGGRYVEPFLGAGAIALALPASIPKTLNDLCYPLVGLWWWIQQNPEALALAVPTAWSNTAAGYAEIRKQYNLRPFSDTSPDPSARFLWLNHTCFNGIYRENKSGGFNVPWGNRPRLAALPTTAQLVRVSTHLQGVTLSALPAIDVIAEARRGDVVFADPPYDGVYTSYTSSGFTADDQAALAEALTAARARGAHVFMTNSDTPLIRRLYAGWSLEPFVEPRRVAAQAASRTAAACVLVS